jgi:tetratricopeptide (TPR) repeat protein
MNERRSAEGHLQRSEEFLAQGEYEKALRENQEVLSMAGKSIPDDKALFNMGLIYAHYKNPEQDFVKSKEFFNSLIEKYPRSPLVEQAKMWVEILGCVEREKLASAALEKQVEGLEKQTEQKESEDLNLYGQDYFTRSQKLLEEKEYDEVLKGAGNILERDGSSNKDKALFNKALVYAHPGYSKKDYKAASNYFKQLIKKYSDSNLDSNLVEQAKIWVSILDVIQVDIEIDQKKKALEEEVDDAIETKKKELEKEIAPPDDAPPGSESTKTVPSQLNPTANALVVKQGKKTIFKEEEPRIALLNECDGTLSALAEKYYGRGEATFCDLMLKANPEIDDVRKIDDVQPIAIPVITPDSFIVEVDDENYRIHIATFYTSESANDSLKGLARSEKLLKVEERQVSSKDTWYRLTMGGFKNKEAALQKVNSLVKKGVIQLPRVKK